MAKKLNPFKDRNWPFDPGELFPTGSNYGGKDEKRALFLSETTAKLLLEANIPTFTLDCLVRLLAWDWLRANDSCHESTLNERRYYC